MTDLGWRADGIARAEAAGGLTLEQYRRPGFTGGCAVRVLSPYGLAGGSGFEVYADPEPEPDDRATPGGPTPQPPR